MTTSSPLLASLKDMTLPASFGHVPGDPNSGGDHTLEVGILCKQPGTVLMCPTGEKIVGRSRCAILKVPSKPYRGTLDMNDGEGYPDVDRFPTYQPGSSDVDTFSRFQRGAADTLDFTSSCSARGILRCRKGGDFLLSTRTAGFAGPPVLGSAMKVIANRSLLALALAKAEGELSVAGLPLSIVFFDRDLTILEEVFEPYREARRLPT